jgi:N-acetylglucosamine kinase-like BadF-type ATPase
MPEYNRILVADSGSSKTEWKVIEGGRPAKSFHTSGINPYFLSSEEIYLLLNKEIGEGAITLLSEIFFYGTGCNSRQKEDIIRVALEKYSGCSNIFVGSDLLGAARSLCQDKPGIGCIMGTGSNSCYYDGEKIVSNIPPLGYILGEEGGGAVLGRKLLSGIIKMQLPEEIRQRFLLKYNLTTAEILDNIYTRPFPNRFLGQFARFLSENSDVPELKEIIITSFDEFIKRNILQYPESYRLPVHFTGSIAFHFSELLIRQIEYNGLRIGIITPSPMEKLVEYHINYMPQV